MRPRRPTTSGFTVLELMVVVVVIAMLVAVGVPLLAGARVRARDGAVKANLRSALGVAVANATVNAGAWPGASLMTNDDKALTYVDAGVASTGPKVVSISTTSGGSRFLAASRSETGTCLTITDSGRLFASNAAKPCATKIGVSGVTSVFAGSGTAGGADGTGTAAQFSFPAFAAVGRSGTIYVADFGNHRIRRVTPAGVVSTLAGSGVAAFADGTGTAASFNHPVGVAVDIADNVYVADEDNHRIRKITPDGMVTTLAGSGAFGWADGFGSAAVFRQPTSIAIDSFGDLYVADYSNHRVRKVTVDGAVTTLAGSGVAGAVDGTGSAAQFHHPVSVTVDANDDLYVSDYGGHNIRKVTKAGVVTTLVGSSSAGYAEGTGTAATFNQPTGVVIDQLGYLYVADGANNRIRVIE